MTRCVIDTNVLINANAAVKAQVNDDILNYPSLIAACVKTLHEIKEKNTYIVLDAGDEIFSEYKAHLNFSGQPGVGDVFFKWLHDRRWSFPSSERIELHKTENGFEEFPSEMEHLGVDPDDKKFFAVSNAHPAKPKIYESSDTKWWNWRDVAMKCGIEIKFVDELYMQDKTK